MSYYLRYAVHNTPAAQKEMKRILEENKRLKALLDLEENIPPPPTKIPTFDFETFERSSIKETRAYLT